MVVTEQKTVAVKTFVSEELRNSFKAACAKEGRNMSDVLAEFVEQYVNKREAPPNSGTAESKGRGKKRGEE
jgi:regulator of PEP synthase PpsR (kinase-PPPase family)